MYDTYHHSSTTIDVVSDASVHTQLCKAAMAWMIAKSPDNQQQAASKRAATSDTTSYHMELEGMYEGLHDAHALLNHKSRIRSICDCESGIKKLYNTQQPITKPRHVMELEMDLIMAIHHLKAESCHDIAFFHFRGHADRE